MKKILLTVSIIFPFFFAQGQIIPCDSVDYIIVSSPNTMVLQLDGTISTGFPGIVTNWDWMICSGGVCYPNTGQTAYYQQFATTDTLQLCLTTILDINTNIFTCISCETLVFDASNGWMLMSIWQPTFINEFNISNKKPLKVIDLLGRETKVKNNEPLFYIYEDGTVEKKIIIE